MFYLIVAAYIGVIRFERYISHRDFAGLYEKVRACATKQTDVSLGTVARVCSAVDLACVLYWKEVQCLQRSAVATYMLKRKGIPARMIIGVRQLPFRAHAWVEVDGHVVNDRPYVREMYTVLDQC